MTLYELDPVKQDLLARLNSLLTNMCFPKYSPKYSKMYSVSYNMLCQTMDVVSSELAVLKGNFNLVNDNSGMESDYPGVDVLSVR